MSNEEQEETIEVIFPRLETERLVLRQVTKDDAADLFSYLQDVEVMKYFGSEPFDDVEEVHGAIDWYDYSYHEQQGMRLGLELKATGKIIGTCGLHSWEPADFRAELVGVLAKDYWGQGLMTEALQAIINYGFEELDLYRIQGKVEPENRVSIRMLQKLGLREEGLLRGYVYVFGEHRDNLMYSLLKTDWQKK